MKSPIIKRSTHDAEIARLNDKHKQDLARVNKRFESELEQQIKELSDVIKRLSIVYDSNYDGGS